jgi:hypothetical protein
MRGTLKDCKGSGSVFDTKLRAFLHKIKHEQAESSAKTDGVGASSGTSTNHDKSTKREKNSKISIIIDDDCETLITCVESVKSESKAIAGTHRDLLNIAKLTSRPGNQPGSIGHLLHRGKSAGSAASAFPKDRYASAFAGASVISELTTLVHQPYTQLQSPHVFTPAQAQVLPPSSPPPPNEGGPGQDSSNLYKP